MDDCINYLAGLLGSFLSNLSSMEIVAGVSILGVLAAFVVILTLIVVLFRR